MVKVDIIDKISIPEGVEVSIDSNQINVKGPKGELSRGIFTPGIKIEVKENEVIVRVDDSKDVKMKIDKSALTSVSAPTGEKEDE